MGMFPQAMFEYTLWARRIARDGGTGLRLMVAATRREKHPTHPTLGVQTSHDITFGIFEKRHIFILNAFFRNFGDFWLSLFWSSVQAFSFYFLKIFSISTQNLVAQGQYVRDNKDGFGIFTWVPATKRFSSARNIKFMRFGRWSKQTKC